jgi:hypothetical protein
MRQMAKGGGPKSDDETGATFSTFLMVANGRENRQDRRSTETKVTNLSVIDNFPDFR